MFIVSAAQKIRKPFNGFAEQVPAIPKMHLTTFEPPGCSTLNTANQLVTRGKYSDDLS